MTSALHRASEWLFPGRLRLLMPVLVMFVLFNTTVRIGLACFNDDARILLPWRIAPALPIGLLFDLGVATVSEAAPTLRLNPPTRRRIDALAGRGR